MLAIVKSVEFRRLIIILIRSRERDTRRYTGSTLGYPRLPYLLAFCESVTFFDLCHVEEPHWLNGGHPRFGAGYQDALDLNLVTTAHLREWMVGRGAERQRISVCHSGIDAASYVDAGAIRTRVRAELDLALIHIRRCRRIGHVNALRSARPYKKKSHKRRTQR